MGPLPVCVLLENVRSLYNVGAFFRTADAVALEKLYLTGITGYPPQRMIAKTALGAEETVPWQHIAEDGEDARGTAIRELRDRRHRNQRACDRSLRLASALSGLRAVRP